MMKDTRAANLQKIPPREVKMVQCPTCGGSGKLAPEAISLGMRIAMARKDRGLTQSELAPKLSVGRAQLANIEGDRSMPSVEVLVRIANTLAVSVDYLLGRH